MDDYILQTRGINKAFTGVQALSDVSVNVRRGEVHGLVGENGAGKSTLIKILSGVYHYDSGEITFDGAPYTPVDPLYASRMGISVVHQELKLVDTLTVMENIYLGRPILSPRGLVDWRQMRRRAGELIASLGIALDPDALILHLSVAQKQIVEICKALVINAKLVIMDEPSATLTPNEIESMYALIRKLSADGITVIYISHRLEEIFDICDTVTVLRDGEKVGTWPVGELDRRLLIQHMVGRDLGMEYPKTQTKIGDVLLEVRQLNMPGVLDDISFTLRAGEILGFAGLVGAGRSEMARAIVGADKGAKGTILLRGKPYAIRDVDNAVRNGIGLIPEERKTQGLVLHMSVAENLSLVRLDNVLTHGVLSRARERQLAKKYVDMLRIRTPEVKSLVLNLSGGNQQKVVIGKWLNANCDVLIVDEPTRGIDVGAKQEIYRLLGELAQSGKAILMISSDLPELLGLCDRIAVMREGHISGILPVAQATQESIMHLAIS